MEFKDRIELLMKTQHMNRQVFGQLTGMSQSTLSNIFNGKTQPTLKIVYDIKDKMPSVNTDWLLFGVGRMFNDRQEDPEQVVQSETVEPTLDFSPANTPPLTATQPVQNQQRVINTPNNYLNFDAKIVDKPRRQITEIRIFYDDQTWETFVPKK
ncbi:MAG: helix-turn-helix transcriptional regulator [Prevotella sp.]|nr:helix-turn-helix transcriptional regulator [Prevotella sp.]